MFRLLDQLVLLLKYSCQEAMWYSFHFLLLKRSFRLLLLLRPFPPDESWVAPAALTFDHFDLPAPERVA
jgi:hypothetical protein